MLPVSLAQCNDLHYRRRHPVISIVKAWVAVEEHRLFGFGSVLHLPPASARNGRSEGIAVLERARRHASGWCHVLVPPPSVLSTSLGVGGKTSARQVDCEAPADSPRCPRTAARPRTDCGSLSHAPLRVSKPGPSRFRNFQGNWNDDGLSLVCPAFVWAALDAAFILHHILPAFIWERRPVDRQNSRRMPLVQRHKLQDRQLRNVNLAMAPSRECS